MREKILSAAMINIKNKYPEYSGLNYLDMTAGFFFPQN